MGSGWELRTISTTGARHVTIADVSLGLILNDFCNPALFHFLLITPLCRNRARQQVPPLT